MPSRLNRIVDILLFDLDGVLLNSAGYHRSLVETVRRVSHGVGVERTFMFHSPRLEKVEVLRQGRVRRAKLYYLRGLTGKAARIKEKARAPKASNKEQATGNKERSGHRA